MNHHMQNQVQLNIGQALLFRLRATAYPIFVSSIHFWIVAGAWIFWVLPSWLNHISSESMFAWVMYAVYFWSLRLASQLYESLAQSSDEFDEFLKLSRLSVLQWQLVGMIMAVLWGMSVGGLCISVLSFYFDLHWPEIGQLLMVMFSWLVFLVLFSETLRAWLPRWNPDWIVQTGLFALFLSSGYLNSNGSDVPTSLHPLTWMLQVAPERGVAVARIWIITSALLVSSLLLIIPLRRRYLR